MKKLNLYVAREFITFFLYTILSFVFISTLFFALIQASKGKINELGWNIYLLEIISNVPLLLEIITPITTLLATILSLVSLSRHSEITAMKASGRSIIQIVFPIFLLSIGISFFSYFNQSYLARFLGTIAEEESVFSSRSFWKMNQDKLFLFKGVSSKTESADISYIFHFDKNHHIKQQSIYKNLSLKEEHWEIQSSLDRILQEEKVIFKTSHSSRIAKDDFPEVFIKKIGNPKYFPLIKVIQEYFRSKKEGVDVKKIEFIILKKLSNFLTSTIMVLIALPFTLFAQREANFGKSIGIALLFGLSFWLIDQTFSALSNTQLVHVFFGAFGSNILFLTTSVVLIYKRQH